MSVFDEVEKFFLQYDGGKGEIGKSFCLRPIYYFKVEKTRFPTLIVQYAMHAREFITSYLALKQIEDFIVNGKIGRVFFIPLVNPDGVWIAENSNFLYKANGRGVDLNVNFDARWGEGEYNVREKGAENFIGDFPFSESETVALRDFTLSVKPDVTISYHSKGEEIYWEFHQDEYRRERDLDIAKSVSKCTGYQIKSTPNSAGGYKDWCVEKLKIPALTIEVGNDQLSHPIGKERSAEIYEKNKGVIYAVINALMVSKCN